jgi:cell division protein FtsQ
MDPALTGTLSGTGTASRKPSQKTAASKAAQAPKAAPARKHFNWGLALNILGWIGVLAGCLWAGRHIQAFLLNDPRFLLQCPEDEITCAGFEIHGTTYASRTRIQSVFAGDFHKSVFVLPMAERRRRLLALDWIRSATITRIWPNRIVVNVAERHPSAFAKLPLGDSSRFRLALVDDEGVLLSIPARVRFHLPVLSGLTEDQTEEDRRVRVKAMHKLLADMGPSANDISEINASNIREMRIVADVEGEGVDLWLGDQHFRTRYLNFLSHYEQIRKHSATTNVFDLRHDDRIIAK